MNSNAKRTTILDCTIRDGGYLNKWNFEKKIAREVYRAISKAGIDIMEIGFRSSESHFDRRKYGLWRFSDEDVLKETLHGLRGAKIAVMSDVGRVSIDDFIPADESIIDIVRVASHRMDLFSAISLLEKIKEKGYTVSLNVMGYANYSKNDKKELLSALKDSDIDILYLADSYGSIFPHQVESIFLPYLELKNLKIGFHAHNNLQMAFANTLEAMRCGVHLVDCTLYGMGRGAGNLPTEILIKYMQLLNEEKYDVIPILNCIDTFFLPLRKEMEWGYQLHYMLSGMYQCHPNYAKELVDLREYTAEDVCHAMAWIKKENSEGYSKKILSRVVEDGLINKSQCAVEASRPVPYQGRHQDRDFLILANGPSLIKHKQGIDRFIQKRNPVLMGANNLLGLFEPHYHAFNNKKRFIKYGDTVASSSTLLLSQHFSQALIADYTSMPYELIYFKDTLNEPFDIKKGVIQANCRTISILLMGVALTMGAKRIFVAGMDGYLLNDQGSHLFYDEKDDKTQKMLIEQHQWCQKFLNQIDHYLKKEGKAGVEILTPTSYRAFYSDIHKYI